MIWTKKSIKVTMWLVFEPAKKSGALCGGGCFCLGVGRWYAGDCPKQVWPKLGGVWN